MTLFLFLLCAVAAILLMGGYYTYRIAFYSPKKGRDKISTFASHKYDPYRKEINRLFCQLSDRSYEEVSIVSFDGLTLFGRYYHVKDGAPLDIAFHGYRSSALTDFAGGSELSFSMEHNLLLIDERAHGRSEGRTITFGIQERWDADSWVRYVVERFGADTEIILYGISMGAATVLMASELELPASVRGIIADCGFSSPYAIMKSVLHWRCPWLVSGPLLALTGVFTRLFGGFGLREVSATEAVAHTKLPILFIHGTGDRFVPCSMSQAAYDACTGEKRLILVEGAGHGQSYLVDRPRVQAAVREFLTDYVLQEAST